MEYKNLGNTEIKVSLLCLGTMSFGEQNTEKDAHDQLDCAIDAGINFIDTAEMYAIPPKEETCGLTENILVRGSKSINNVINILLLLKLLGLGWTM